VKGKVNNKQSEKQYTLNKAKNMYSTHTYISAPLLVLQVRNL